MNVGVLSDPKTVVIDEQERIYGPLIHLGWIGNSKALCGWSCGPNESFEPCAGPGAVCQKCVDRLISLKGF